MRIAIVNDSPLAVEALRRALRRGGHQVAWIARDGAEAVAACAGDVPDVVLMDLHMPIMGGVECTRRIMAESPCAILVVTAGVDRSYAAVYDAMGAGALGAVNTPVLRAGTPAAAGDGEGDGDGALLARLETIGKLVDPGASGVRPPARRPARDSGDHTVPPLVAIGASTGGPQALAELLSQLPADLGAAIVIIQHVDAEFATGLVSWLRERAGFPIEIASEGCRLEAGRALVAATNDHLVLRDDLHLSYTPHPRKYPFRPSVDVFFQSAALKWKRPSVGVLLTGMGRDGAAGLLALRRARWTTIAQDEATSVVFGMPRAAAELGAAELVLPLERIGPAIIHALGAPPRRTRPMARQP